MTSSHIPEGPGSASQLPNPLPGFTSRFINANGLRQHVIIGGDGPPLLLVHGWPQFWYQFRLIMPALARHFEVIAPDQRGRGLTDKPPPGGTGSGYDTGTLAEDLAALMDALGHRRFTVVGCDTGMDIAYALAADHRDRVDRLAVCRGRPAGRCNPHRPCSCLRRSTSTCSTSRSTGSLDERAARPRREDVFFGFIFDVEAFKKLPGNAVRVYIDNLADSLPSLRGSFGFYQALDTTTAQNQQRAKKKLTLPVLAVGGAESGGTGPGTR